MPYKAGFEQKFLLASDVHFDNPDCDRKLFKKHLDQAVEQDAGILINGDFFCLMEGRSDPRNSKKIRNEHLGINYLDNVIEEAAEFLEPYAKNIIFIGMGNHESAILKRSETNPTERLCGLLKYKTKEMVYNGHYSGFVKFMFYQNTKGGHKGMRQSIILSYHHGWGGSSNMTKGVNKHMQRLTYVPDADIHWLGHSHQEYVVTHQRMRLSQKGKIFQDECLLVNTGTYKDEFKSGKGGWVIERGISPKPIGSFFLTFYYSDSNGKDNKFIKPEITRAK
tara:strand:- start:447 stop:1283 length:837 start_codon:yes stop_codon:yes gene_type:complete